MKTLFPIFEGLMFIGYAGLATYLIGEGYYVCASMIAAAAVVFLVEGTIRAARKT